MQSHDSRFGFRRSAGPIAIDFPGDYERLRSHLTTHIIFFPNIALETMSKVREKQDFGSTAAPPRPCSPSLG